MTTAFNLGLAAYLVALVASVLALVVRKRWIELGAIAFLVAGVLIQTIYMAMRWHIAMRPPFSNMFESLVLFAWAIVIVYLVVRMRIRIPVLGAATALGVVLTLAYASGEEADIRPLIPALQSNWLSVHVFTCFLGYAGFAVSFLAALSFLASGGMKLEADTRDALEAIEGKTIAFGFLFLSVGIITGSVWANSAWGTYWSWDPKETWSLITWFVYAVYLHLRFMRGWGGKRAAWVSALGFAAVLFTYFGVNFWLKGLHSYA
jgi:ABC-type transport system involved in cytochrome c biogenesis permease subunit